MSATHGWRATLYEVIFGHDTPAGRRFDVALIAAILLSVLAVMLDTVATLHDRYGNLLLAVEWVFTILFTVEYGLRLASFPKPWRYARSFFGVVDLLAILPTYLSLVLPGTQYLLTIRILRVLRVYRILKLVEYLGESRMLLVALRDSRRKITVFLFAVLALVVILGSMMYLVEGHTNGFTSIPQSIYWTIVTLTTVGYGDITPVTSLGQVAASLIMLLGYAIIAVPTGIVTVALSRTSQGAAAERRVCPDCGQDGHTATAVYCQWCSARLIPASLRPAP